MDASICIEPNTNRATSPMLAVVDDFPRFRWYFSALIHLIGSWWIWLYAPVFTGGLEA
jgi:hypothetical protein